MINVVFVKGDRVMSVSCIYPVSCPVSSGPSLSDIRDYCSNVNPTNDIYY